MAALPLRLGVVDDHPPILRGVLAGLAETLAGPFEPVTASTVDELIAEAEGLPDGLRLTLLDVQLADGSTPEDNVARLVDRGWPVLLYTQETNRAVVGRCFRAGAAGIVAKHEDFDVLARAIAVILDGEPYLSGDWAAAIEDDLAAGPALAPRETEALRLYAMGLPLKSVARRMGVSPETAKEYLLRTRRKYADAGRPAPTKTDLYVRAVEDGILPRPHG